MTGALIALIGAGGVKVALPATLSVDDSVTDPTDALANLALETDGDIAFVKSSGGGLLGDWIFPVIGVSNYEARMSTVSGSLTTGTAGVWQALSSNRTWGVSQNVVGTNLYTGTLEIRHATSLVVLASTDAGGVTLSANVDA